MFTYNSLTKEIRAFQIIQAKKLNPICQFNLQGLFRLCSCPLNKMGGKVKGCLTKLCQGFHWNKLDLSGSGFLERNHYFIPRMHILKIKDNKNRRITRRGIGRQLKSTSVSLKDKYFTLNINFWDETIIYRKTLESDPICEPDSLLYIVVCQLFAMVVKNKCRSIVHDANTH